MRAPVESKALLCMTLELNLRVDLSIWLRTVLGPVENEDRTVDSERSNEIGVLGAVASLIDFAWVINLLHNTPFHSSCIGRGGGLAVATDFATVFIVVAHIGANGFGRLDLGNLHMVRLPIRGVGSYKEAVDPTVLAFGLLHIREPLNGECWPWERIAADYVSGIQF